MRPITAAFWAAFLLELCMPRTLNAATLLLNASTEQTRLLPYDDARPNYVLKPGDKIIGTLTVGRGHCGPDVHIGQAWTMAQVEGAQMARSLYRRGRSSEGA